MGLKPHLLQVARNRLGFESPSYFSTYSVLCILTPSSIVKQTADVKISKLIRVRSNCCLYTQPQAYCGRGRPRRHGHKFKLNDINTHIHEDEMIEIEVEPKKRDIRSSKNVFSRKKKEKKRGSLR